MDIAVIKTGGKQYKVKVGDKLKVEKIEANEGDSLKFQSLLIADEKGKSIKIGSPILKDEVEGKILEQGRADKISVIKFKRKTRYKRNVGHRQRYTKVEITKIS